MIRFARYYLSSQEDKIRQQDCKASRPGIMAKQRTVARKPLYLPVVSGHIMHEFDHVYALSASLEVQAER
jgi:hypothetical protein